MCEMNICMYIGEMIVYGKSLIMIISIIHLPAVNCMNWCSWARWCELYCSCPALVVLVILLRLCDVFLYNYTG